MVKKLVKKTAMRPAKKRQTRRASPLTELNDQQKLFAREYLVDLNGKAAAIRAGYSPNTAEQQAARLLRIVKIQEEIQRQMNARLHRLDRTADGVLERLFDEVDADLAEIFNEDGSLKSMHEWPKVWRKGLVLGIEISELFEPDDEGQRQQVGFIKKIKLSERIKRLELIGRHVKIGAFKDRVEHKHDFGKATLRRALRARAIAPNDPNRPQPRGLPADADDGGASTEGGPAAGMTSTGIS